MELIFVRHGETELNKKRFYQGLINESINEEGIIQANEVKEKLKDFTFHRAYTSPLKRTEETLNIILDGRENCEVIKDKRICEIDFGLWDSVAYKDVEKNYSNEYKSFVNDYKDFVFPKGESFKDFYNRCTSFLDDVVDVNSSETILVAAHGGVIRAFLCHMLGLGEDMFYSFSVKQGCYTRILAYEGINLVEEINK